MYQASGWTVGGFFLEGKKIYSENHENDLSIPINFDISTSSLILDYENRYFSI